jgi:hypothetical protein
MKNNSQKILLFSSMLLFVGLCLVFIFLWREVNNNNQKTKSEMLAWQTEANRREQITMLDNSIGQISNDKTELQTHFAQSSDIVPFLNSLEQMASPSGSTIEIDSVDTGTNNSSLVIGLKASGSFESVYKFLTLLENSPYQLDFLSMDMHKLTELDVSSKNIKNSDWEAVFKIQLLNFTQ